MSQFTEYKGLNLTAIANQVSDFWKENKTFEKSVEMRAGEPEYVFYEGPPSANGMPRIPHFMSRAFNDIFFRYQPHQ